MNRINILFLLAIKLLNTKGNVTQTGIIKNTRIQVDLTGIAPETYTLQVNTFEGSN